MLQARLVRCCTVGTSKLAHYCILGMFMRLLGMFMRMGAGRVLADWTGKRRTYYVEDSQSMANRFLGISKVTILTLVVLSFVLANTFCVSLVTTSQFSQELESERTDECERDCNEAIFTRQRLRRVRELHLLCANSVDSLRVKHVGSILKIGRVDGQSLSARSLPLRI